MDFSSVFRPLRTFWWLFPALIRRYNLFLLIGFSAGLILFMIVAFIFPTLNSRFKQPETKRIGIIGNYTPTDFPIKIQSQISFGLTSLTTSGEATPEAALNWEVKDDGKTYTFHLAQNISWQDGSPFKAPDVNYNLKDAEILMVDDFTIQIKLKEPFSPLPALLSQPLFKPGLVGLGGRYKAVSIETKDSQLTALTLESSASGNKMPIINYKFYPSPQEAVLAYKLGEIDSIEGLADLSPLVGWPVKVETLRTKDWHIVLFYNTEDKLLSAKNVRQALTYALPPFPPDEKAGSPLSSLSWAYKNQIKNYEPDLDIAKKLMQTDEATDSAGQKVTLSTTPSYRKLAEEIAKSWENLGLQIEVKIENEVPAEFQVLLTAQEIPPDPDQYSLWHSTQRRTNITRYKSPRIDKLLEDGRKLTDREERRKKYIDFQKYLLDDAPAAFLYYPSIYNISRH